MSKFEVFSGPYFPVFGLKTETYSVNLRIQSKRGKLRTTRIVKSIQLNPFVSNAPFLYPLKRGGRKGIEKGCIRNKRVKGDSDKKYQKSLRKTFLIKVHQPDLFFTPPNPFLFAIKNVRNNKICMRIYYDFGRPPTT